MNYIESELKNILAQPPHKRAYLVNRLVSKIDSEDLSSERFKVLSYVFLFFFALSLGGAFIFSFYLVRQSFGQPRGLVLVTIILSGIFQVVPVFFSWMAARQRYSAGRLRVECEALERLASDELKEIRRHGETSSHPADSW